MRKINQVVIHCSATKTSMDIGVAEIRKWHLARGWNDIGYHYVIRRDGTTEDGRPNQKIGAHVKGHNQHTIGICLVGGLDDNGEPEANFTKYQERTLKLLVDFLCGTYKLTVLKDVLGHRDFAGVHKDCPCFDVTEWLISGDMVRPRAGS